MIAICGYFCSPEGVKVNIIFAMISGACGSWDFLEFCWKTISCLPANIDLFKVSNRNTRKLNNKDTRTTSVTSSLV